MAMFIRHMQGLLEKFFKREENDENQVSRIEMYLGILYKLLIWEDPLVSGLAILFTHILFWLIVYFELRLYGIFFLLILSVCMIDAKLREFPASTNNSISLTDIRQWVNVISRIFHYLTTLRSEHPGTFCIGMCTGFLALSILGRTLSGLLLSYLGVLSLLLVPGIVSRLPPEVLNGIRQTLRTLSTDEGVVAENELLPSGQENAWFERDVDCESFKSDKTADSCSNSFISGVTSMPSYLEAEGSLDDLDEDLDLIPRSIPMVVPSNVSTDSSDSEHRDIKFESSHFNRDSSSDEDSNYAQGLAFSEVDVPDAGLSVTQKIGADLLANLGSMGSSIVSSVLKAASSPAPVAKRSDSDSDFEIIDADDAET